ncbi:MAG: sulfite exporter TauE/SafE family protein [Patescibacteria group bacterium]|jgi:hypothetical protein
MFDILIIFLTSLIATALSSMSGGGASVINIPVLLWLGAPFPLAMSAQKVSSVFWLLPAAYNYLKGRKINWSFLVIFSLLGLIGSYVGVVFIIKINQRVMEIIVGLLILLLVIYTYFEKDAGLTESKVYSKTRQIMAYPFALILGFYESIFGSGNGILMAMITFYTKGFDFIDALGYYFAIAFAWVIFAAGLLIAKGYFSWSIIIPIVVGSVIGGYIGSKYAKYKGNKFIKMVFVIFGSILGIKLLLGF